jgi:hypothetical protein
MAFSVWAELMDDDAVEAAFGALAAQGVGVGLSLPSVRVGDAGFAKLTRKAAGAGVPVRIWPLLSPEHGYWIGETNVAETRDLMASLLAWRSRRGGPVFDGVSFDLEPDFQYSEALRRCARLRPDRALSLLLNNVTPTRFAKARASLARTVQTLRRAGIVAHAVTYPVVLDQAVGDTTLEDALSIPVSGIDWDEVSFMVYQTPIAQLTGRWFGPALVRSYARTAVERFGDRAGIDLGVVGDHGVGLDAGDRYPTPSALAADLAASRGAGIPLERTRVYGLAGVLDSGGVEAWLAARPSDVEPGESREVEGFRNIVRAIATGLGAMRR